MTHFGPQSEYVVHTWSSRINEFSVPRRLLKHSTTPQVSERGTVEIQAGELDLPPNQTLTLWGLVCYMSGTQKSMTLTISRSTAAASRSARKLYHWHAQAWTSYTLLFEDELYLV